MKRLDCSVLQSELLYQIGKPPLHMLESSADAARGFRLLSAAGIRSVYLHCFVRVFLSSRRSFLIRWPMSAEGSDDKKATNGVSLPLGLPRAGMVNGS